MIKNVESLPKFVQFLLRYIRAIIFVVLGGLYCIAFFFVRGRGGSEGPVPIVTTESRIVKLVDVQEYVPPPPATSVVQVQEQPKASEVVEEVEEIQEQKAPETNVVQAAPAATSGGSEGIEYFPQHKITEVPVFPTKDVQARMVYPQMAYKQGIEGVVYLELFIDDEGNIRKIEVLKDPGHGFAEAAIAAFDGIKCKPATANGKPVAVRFRYPVRFQIKK